MSYCILLYLLPIHLGGFGVILGMHTVLACSFFFVLFCFVLIVIVIFVIPVESGWIVCGLYVDILDRSLIGILAYWHYWIHLLKKYNIYISLLL